MTSADDYVIQLLLDHQYLTDEVVETARSQAIQEGHEYDMDSRAIELLVEMDYISNDQIIELIAHEYGMEVVDLTEFEGDDEAIKAVPPDLAIQHKVFPVAFDGSMLDLAIADPMVADAVDSVAHMTGLIVNPKIATLDAIEKCIERYYGSSEMRDVAGMFDDGGAAAALENVSVEDDGPIMQYVNKVITDAIALGVSDIHMEPLEKRFRVRYRLDGRLQEIEDPPKRLQASIISRIKIMAEVSIAEKRIPQDGRIQVKSNDGKDLDLRVSVLPTAYGESIVMRILDKEGLKLGLPQLGFFSDDQEVFERLINMPDGVFLVTGPTGSGKSTTLYSALNQINKPDRKIITVEDPVEYQLGGINQVQVRKEVGMTFASALKAMLRQAPNIVMVGEIRDKETAEIAIQASLTGHMVFSTLHTNDAVSAVTRLVDIGVKSYLVSSALRGALAQRLIRKIHPSCKVEYTPDARELNGIGMTAEDAAKSSFYKAVPNAESKTGYKGRNGVFELFVVNEELENMIYAGATLVELRAKAKETGMRSMREDGIRKVTAGVTTISELLHATTG